MTAVVCARRSWTPFWTTFSGPASQETLADSCPARGPRALPTGRQPALAIRYAQGRKPPELSVFTGRRKTPPDLATNARDIPCQAACPANTNVPEYIRHIAHGRPRGGPSNQPGRQRPAQRPGPRLHAPLRSSLPLPVDHTRGPVRICHLKRFCRGPQRSPASPCRPGSAIRQAHGHRRRRARRGWPRHAN